MAAELHLAEDSLPLHLFLERLQRLINVVITNQNLHVGLTSISCLRVLPTSRVTCGRKNRPSRRTGYGDGSGSTARPALEGHAIITPHLRRARDLPMCRKRAD